MARPAIPEANRQRLDAAVDLLRSRLPDYWKADVTGRRGATATVSLAGPIDSVDVSVLIANRVDPRDLDRLPIPGSPALVVAPWLSPRTRELLVEAGVGYIDLTGNIDVRDARSGLFLRDVGDQRDPNPPTRKGPSVAGPRAWALLRTLAEVEPSYTAGDLATALDLDDGYVSRALQVLVDERLIERRPRGPVTSVNWQAVLRRISESYSVLDANDTSTWIATAGPTRLLTDLADLRVGRWAVTSSFVAASISPVAAPEIAVIYAEDPERLAKAARLLPTTTGANVILAKPYDPIVFTRQREAGGAPSVSLAQAAVDLLTGPARMPAEGEALLTWMAKNEPRWRTRTLEA